jgi:hypothetical protein
MVNCEQVVDFRIDEFTLGQTLNDTELSRLNFVHIDYAGEGLNGWRRGQTVLSISQGVMVQINGKTATLRSGGLRLGDQASAARMVILGSGLKTTDYRERGIRCFSPKRASRPTQSSLTVEFRLEKVDKIVATY